MVPNQENMEGDQPVQSHSHVMQPLQPQTYVQEHYPGETGFQGSEHCNTDGRNVWTAGESMLKNKPHLVKFNNCIIVSLWTVHPHVWIFIEPCTLLAILNYSGQDNANIIFHESFCLVHDMSMLQTSSRYQSKAKKAQKLEFHGDRRFWLSIKANTLPKATRTVHTLNS